MAVVAGINANNSQNIAAYYGPGAEEGKAGRGGEPCHQQQTWWDTDKNTGDPAGHYLNFMDAIASYIANTTGARGTRTGFSFSSAVVFNLSQARLGKSSFSLER